jgi:hypothetical protein
MFSKIIAMIFENEVAENLSIPIIIKSAGIA